jgi:hypothetical protein
MKQNNSQKQQRDGGVGNQGQNQPLDTKFSKLFNDSIV